MAVYAFDVDETLEVSKGPVKLVDLVKLREHGHIVGLCGNWAMVTLHCPDWHHICSFVGPCGIQKHDFLRQLRQYIPGHDYVMVGNILGISGASDDRGAAETADRKRECAAECVPGSANLALTLPVQSGPPQRDERFDIFRLRGVEPADLCWHRVGSGSA